MIKQFNTTFTTILVVVRSNYLANQVQRKSMRNLCPNNLKLFELFAI